jgi:hypothetical protein
MYEYTAQFGVTKKHIFLSAQAECHTTT